MSSRMFPVVTVSCLALCACGGSSPSGGDSKVTVSTVVATGTVGGVVLDAAPGLPPLAGATVTVFAGGAPMAMVMSDMAGAFAVKEVPVGTVIVKLAAAEHFDVYLSGALQAQAGNFPVSNAVLTLGPIAMVGNKGQLALRLVDDAGAPAAGIRVTARAVAAFLDLASGGGSQRGVIDTAATSGADGLATLTALPDYATVGPLLSDAVTVNIPPARLGGPNTYQFLGLNLDLAATRYSANLGQTPTLVLAGPRSPLTVLSSNIDCLETTPSNGTCNVGALGSFVGASGPVTIAFNQAIAVASVRVSLLGEFGGPAPATVNPTVNGNLLSLAFSKQLDPGRYNLVLHANAAIADQTREYNLTAPLFIASPQGTTVTVSPNSRIENPGSPGDFLVVFSEPIGVGYGSQAPIPCVVYYDTDLDGSPNISSPGEWSGNGNQSLKCDPGVGYNARPGLFLRPAEPQPGQNQLPITGFSSQWRLTVNPSSAICANQMMMCSASQKTVHLVFSRNSDPALTVKRANGGVVPDQTFALPSF